MEGFVMNTKKLFFPFLTIAFLSGLFFSGPVLANEEGCEPKPMTAEEYDDLYGGD